MLSQNQATPALSASFTGLATSLHAGCRKERRVEHEDGKVHDEHEQADKADEVQGLFDGPNLVGRFNGIQGAQRLLEELYRESGRLGAEVRPGVDYGRPVDGPGGGLSVNFLGVDGVSLARLKAGGVNTEIQEGLGVIAFHEVRGAELVAVLVRGFVEELVVYAGDDGHVPAAVDVGVVGGLLVAQRVSVVSTYVASALLSTTAAMSWVSAALS